MDFNWRAVYKDGSDLWQSGADGKVKNTYADIDRQQLEVFGLYKGDQPLVLVDLSDDCNGDSDVAPKRLIYRRRCLKNTRGLDAVVYLVGWQRKVSGRNIQSICFVSQDGTIILGGQWQDDIPLRGSIIPLPWEDDLIE